jgi:hypothetical protein
VLINTYMPANGTLSDANYAEVLDEVFEIIQKYSPSATIIWTGDMNAHPSRKKLNPNDRLFTSFCAEYDLLVQPLSPDVPTYHHFSNTATSQIDHVVSLKTQSPAVQEARVQIRCPLNTSPHDAINIVTSKMLRPIDPQKKPHNPTALPHRTNWQKVDKEMYSCLTESRLTALYETISPHTPSDILASRVNNILTECSKQCEPPPKKTRKTKHFKWLPELKPAVAASKRAFYEWKASDEPQDDRYPLYLTMKLAKKDLQRDYECKNH